MSEYHYSSIYSNTLTMYVKVAFNLHFQVLEEFSNWMCEIKLSPQKAGRVNINTGLKTGDLSLTSRTGTGRPKTTHQDRLDINKG